MLDSHATSIRMTCVGERSTIMYVTDCNSLLATTVSFEACHCVILAGAQASINDVPIKESDRVL